MDMFRQLNEDAINLIKASLPAGIDQRRLDELLPLILAEWWVHHLPEHLSRESRATVRRRFEQVRKVGERANELLEALAATDQRGRFWIALEMAREKGSGLSSREKTTEMEERLVQESSFLINLATATTRLMEKKPGRGTPNICAYLVMMDLAAIFEWLTDRKATREVDRDSKKETGAFWHFAAAVWPLVFGKGCLGLPSAMKNWAALCLRHDEKSQLIMNIAIRHPASGIFDTTPQ